MQKIQNIIGIDPDVEKSGIAILNRGARTATATVMTFPELLERLRTFASMPTGYVVVIEAGWLNEANWHLKSCRSFSMVAKIGENVGRCHEVGRKIAEWCEYHGINYVLRRPLVKCWKGNDRKITTEELNEQLRQYGYAPLGGRLNQEMRDAALLALFGY